MLPSITVAWGGGLQVHGSPVGPRSLSMDLTDAVGTDIVDNGWNRTIPGIDNDYYAGVYGGLSIMPQGFANHKPGVGYYGDFYFQKSLNELQSMVPYLCRYDGSGLFTQTENVVSNHFQYKSHSGRGVEFLSPSGANTDILAHPLCAIVHNGSLFFVGAFSEHNIAPAVSEWRTIKDWNVVAKSLTGGPDDGVSLPRRRAYGSFTIHKKKRVGKDFRDAASNLRIMHDRTTLSGIAVNSECLAGCDAISWGNNIIYANHADIVEFPGGSGQPRFIERTDANHSAKCFVAYPSGGFVNSQPVGQRRLMMLTSSGVVKDILFPGDPGHNPSGQPFLGPGFEVASGRAFGTRSLVNLGLLVQDSQGPKVRTGGQLARTLNSVSEPTRSCLIKNFANKLHAFFISASSGYYHFVCDGSPDNINNWEDRTPFVPDALKLFDGDMYGYVDDLSSRLTCMHVAKSNIGLYGVVGSDRGAGGWSIYELTQELEWEKAGSGGDAGPGVGLIPYDQQSAYVTIPSGTFASNPEVIPSTDYALLRFDLFTPRAPNIKVDVDIDYSLDDGSTWQEARRFTDYITGSGLGIDKTGLEASPIGTTHEFYWAHVSDVGFNAESRAKLRVRPKNFRPI